MSSSIVLTETGPPGVQQDDSQKRVRFDNDLAPYLKIRIQQSQSPFGSQVISIGHDAARAKILSSYGAHKANETYVKLENSLIRRDTTHAGRLGKPVVDRDLMKISFTHRGTLRGELKTTKAQLNRIHALFEPTTEKFSPYDRKVMEMLGEDAATEVLENKYGLLTWHTKRALADRFGPAHREARYEESDEGESTELMRGETRDVRLIYGVRGDIYYTNVTVRSRDVERVTEGYLSNIPQSKVTSDGINEYRVFRSDYDVKTYFMGEHMREMSERNISVGLKIVQSIPHDRTRKISVHRFRQESVENGDQQYPAIKITKIYAPYDPESEKEDNTVYVISYYAIVDGKVASCVLSAVPNEVEENELMVKPRVITVIADTAIRLAWSTHMKVTAASPIDADRVVLYNAGERKDEIARNVLSRSMFTGLPFHHLNRVYRVSAVVTGKYEVHCFEGKSRNYVTEVDIHPSFQHVNETSVDAIESVVTNPFINSAELILRYTGIEYARVLKFYNSAGRKACDNAAAIFVKYVASLLRVYVKAEDVSIRESDLFEGTCGLHVDEKDIRAAVFIALRVNTESVPGTTYVSSTPYFTDDGGNDLNACISEALEVLVHEYLYSELSGGMIYDEFRVVFSGDDFNPTVQLARMGLSLLYSAAMTSRSLAVTIPTRYRIALTIPMSLTNKGLLVYKLNPGMMRLFSQYYRNKDLMATHAMKNVENRRFGLESFDSKILGMVTEPMISDSQDAGIAIQASERYVLDNIINGVFDILETMNLSQIGGVVYTALFCIVCYYKRSDASRETLREVYVEPNPRVSQIIVSERNKRSLTTMGGGVSYTAMPRTSGGMAQALIDFKY